jgi:hypothetical protein
MLSISNNTCVAREFVCAEVDSNGNEDFGIGMKSSGWQKVVGEWVQLERLCTAREPSFGHNIETEYNDET